MTVVIDSQDKDAVIVDLQRELYSALKEVRRLEDLLVQAIPFLRRVACARDGEAETLLVQVQKQVGYLLEPDYPTSLMTH
jgi:hypothetical protein